LAAFIAYSGHIAGHHHHSKPGLVQTHLLFITVDMPQILLLLITACFGFAIGVLVSLLTSLKKGKEQKPESQ